MTSLKKEIKTQLTFVLEYSLTNLPPRKICHKFAQFEIQPAPDSVTIFFFKFLANTALG